MHRRRFLLMATAGTLGAALGSNALMKYVQAVDAPRYFFSATDNAAGGHFLSRLEVGNQQIQSIPVPVRGHAVLPLADGKVLMFGRRPAFECALVEFGGGRVTPLKAMAGRHFNGHGCLSAHGDVLFTTENAYDEKRGVLGIRDSKTFRYLGEYDTYGLDPHDVHLLPDGKTLVVANGGIEQHPDFGRRKLNLDTMQPSLVYLDAATGKRIAEYRLPDHHLSIRHLLVTPGGDVGIALQYEGDLYRAQPASLVAWQANGGELKLLTISREAIAPFNGYMADLAYDAVRDILAVTSPRGNHVTFWSVREQRFLHALPLPEPSALVFRSEQGSFLISSVQGDVLEVHASSKEAVVERSQTFTDIVWDNHCMLA